MAHDKVVTVLGATGAQGELRAAFQSTYSANVRILFAGCPLGQHRVEASFLLMCGPLGLFTMPRSHVQTTMHVWQVEAL